MPMRLLVALLAISCGRKLFHSDESRVLRLGLTGQEGVLAEYVVICLADPLIVLSAAVMFCRNQKRHCENNE